jgi:hypothetical protein
MRHQVNCCLVYRRVMMMMMMMMMMVMMMMRDVPANWLVTGFGMCVGSIRLSFCWRTCMGSDFRTPHRHRPQLFEPAEDVIKKFCEAFPITKVEVRSSLPKASRV